MGIAQILKRVIAYQAASQDGPLSQNLTNGDSQIGTLQAEAVPKFLTNNPMPNGAPWSTLNSKTNYYNTHPDTGVIRTYDFHVTRGRLAPDGYERDVLLVNGAFPGPLIEANWGDTIQVTLHNELPDEGTALHWHGFLQKGTPWEDGVPAISQCPVAPGECFTYQFKASLYGTSWYHSHYSSQYAGGLVGPIIIHGPRTYEYDVDLGPIMLSDWYHDNHQDLVKKVLTPNLPPGPPVFSDNNLINGKNNFNCSLMALGDQAACVNNAGLSKFRFQSGKTHLLRLVNVGAEALQRFSIDGHTMTVVSNDFVDIEPYETKVVTLGVGQRSDVLVTADGDLSAYWMRANISVPCSATRAPDPSAKAAIFYDDVDTEAVPESTAWHVPDPANCMNDDLELTRPVMELALPEPSVTYNMDINLFRNGSNITLWSLGSDTTFRGNYNSPTLLLSNLGNHTFEKEWNVINTGSHSSVRVVVHSKFPLPHPMHLHGFNMYVLSVGPKKWDGTIVRPENPMRRDVIQIPGPGHLVFQFDAAHNPGVWPFHCHIAWHASGGLFAQFLTAPDEVHDMKIPNVVAETCRQWGKWTHTNIPDQIDSGL
ncbi:Laccase-2 [Escovopsis weberi]|uniref:Laccase-2 n=1 Tax=Escovopsis weberi TaxID=150374 RepID=A0A0M9VVE2_ESCWE|nr:Laccase-2 [Escovopsis weberi]